MRVAQHLLRIASGLDFHGATDGPRRRTSCSSQRPDHDAADPSTQTDPGAMPPMARVVLAGYNPCPQLLRRTLAGPTNIATIAGIVLMMPQNLLDGPDLPAKARAVCSPSSEPDASATMSFGASSVRELHRHAYFPKRVQGGRMVRDRGFTAGRHRGRAGEGCKRRRECARPRQDDLSAGSDREPFGYCSWGDAARRFMRDTPWLFAGQAPGIQRSNRLLQLCRLRCGCCGGACGRLAP